MPTNPSVWYSGPLSPQQLNQDLYSPNGSGYSANGILFFTHRPLLHEALTQSRLMTVTTSGSWNVIPGTNTTAFAVVDTGALFGTGGDNPGPYALYQFIPNALAGSGIGYQPGNLSPVAAQASSGTAPAFPAGAGGNYLVFHTVTGQTAGSSPAAIGAGLSQTPGFGEVFVWQGGMQPHTTGTQGAAYFLDLINAGGGAYGVVGSPVTGQQLCQALVPYGDGWVADWAVEILATASTSDVNNFSLVLGGHTVATATNPGTVGVYGQSPYTFNSTVLTGEYLSVTAGVTVPTSQSTYGAVLYGDGLPTIGNGYTWQPAVFLADGTAVSEQLPVPGTGDSAGFTPRHSWVWASVTYQGQLNALNQNAYTPDGNLAGWEAFAHTTIASVTPPGTPPPSAYGVQITGDGSATTAGVWACPGDGHPRGRVPGVHEHVHERRHQHLLRPHRGRMVRRGRQLPVRHRDRRADPAELLDPRVIVEHRPHVGGDGEAVRVHRGHRGRERRLDGDHLLRRDRGGQPGSAVPAGILGGAAHLSGDERPRGARAGSDVPEQPAGVPGRRGADHLDRERGTHSGDVPDQRMAATGDRHVQRVPGVGVRLLQRPRVRPVPGVRVFPVRRELHGVPVRGVPGGQRHLARRPPPRTSPARPTRR